MRTTTTRAPYKVGDKVRALFMGAGGTTLGALTVERVTALTDGRWRIECPRPHDTCPTVAFTVGADGRDANGYCERAL